MTQQPGTRRDDHHRTGFDPMLRDRVADSVKQLLETFDAVQANLTPASLEQLRADVDRAMRAIGRVRLDAERLMDEGN